MFGYCFQSSFFRQFLTRPPTPPTRIWTNFMKLYRIMSFVCGGIWYPNSECWCHWGGLHPHGFAPCAMLTLPRWGDHDRSARSWCTPCSLFFFLLENWSRPGKKKTFFWFLYGQLCISCMAVCTKLVVSSSMCSVAVATGSTPPSSLSTGDQHLKMDSLLKPWTSGLVVPTFITAWVSYLGYDKCQGGMDSWMFW